MITTNTRSVLSNANKRRPVAAPAPRDDVPFDVALREELERVGSMGQAMVAAMGTSKSWAYCIRNGERPPSKQLYEKLCVLFPRLLAHPPATFGGDDDGGRASEPPPSASGEGIRRNVIDVVETRSRKPRDGKRARRDERLRPPGARENAPSSSPRALHRPANETDVNERHPALPFAMPSTPGEPPGMSPAMSTAVKFAGRAHLVVEALAEVQMSEAVADLLAEAYLGGISLTDVEGLLRYYGPKPQRTGTTLPPPPPPPPMPDDTSDTGFLER